MRKSENPYTEAKLSARSVTNFRDPPTAGFLAKILSGEPWRPTGVRRSSGLMAGLQPDTPAVVEVLHDLEFNLSFSGGCRSVDEETNVLPIGPLRRLAACFGMPPNPVTTRCLLGKCVMKKLYVLGIAIQEGHNFFFAPALAALLDVRAAGSTENPAGEPTPAALGVAGSTGNPAGEPTPAALIQTPVKQQMISLTPN